MKEETLTLEQDQLTYKQNLHRKKAVIGSIKTLEGELADYNFAVDKVRSGVTPEELLQQEVLLKASNDKRLAELDSTTLEIKTSDAQLTAALEELRTLDQEIDLACQADTSDEMTELRRQREEANTLAAALQSDVNTLATQIAEQERILAEPMRKNYEELRAKQQKLQDENAYLLKQVERSKLSPEAQLESLEAQIKDDTEAIERLEAEMLAMGQEGERLKSRIAKIDAELADKSIDPEEEKKLQTLWAKGKEMDDFLADFEANKEAGLKKIEEQQKRIVELLEKQTRINSRVADVDIDELANEVTFKADQLKDSEVTQAKLKEELDRRQAELLKLKNVQPVIEEEIRLIDLQIAEAQKEIAQHPSEQEMIRMTEDENKEIVILKIKLEESEARCATLEKGLKADLEALESSEENRQTQECNNRLVAIQQKVNDEVSTLTAHLEEEDHCLIKLKLLKAVENANKSLLANYN